MALVTVWFQFGVVLNVDDTDDASEMAEKGRPILIDRINSDSIEENIQDWTVDEE